MGSMRFLWKLQVAVIAALLWSHCAAKKDDSEERYGANEDSSPSPPPPSAPPQSPSPASPLPPPAPAPPAALAPPPAPAPLPAPALAPAPPAALAAPAPAPAPTLAVPRWNMAQDVVVKGPIREIPDEFTYEAQGNKICAGTAYTDQESIGCLGWQGISEEECQKKCTDNTAPDRGPGVPRCPAKKCIAAAFFPDGGWCQLFEPAQCRAQVDDTDVKSFMKVPKGIWNTPAMEKMKETMASPVAQNLLKAGAVAAAAGVVAAGVGGAIATRNQQEAREKKQKQQEQAAIMAATSTTAPPGVFLSTHKPTGTDNGIVMLDGPAFPPAARIVETTSAPAAASSLSVPSSSSFGMPLWLPLILILFCCCCCVMLTVFAFRNTSKSRSGKYQRYREESFDEEEDDEEEAAYY